MQNPNLPDGFIEIKSIAGSFYLKLDTVVSVSSLDYRHGIHIVTTGGEIGIGLTSSDAESDETDRLLAAIGDDGNHNQNDTSEQDTTVDVEYPIIGGPEDGSYRVMYRFDMDGLPEYGTNHEGYSVSLIRTSPKNDSYDFRMCKNGAVLIDWTFLIGENMAIAPGLGAYETMRAALQYAKYRLTVSGASVFNEHPILRTWDWPMDLMTHNQVLAQTMDEMREGLL